jgi:glycerol-3-phosphate dehydrogenase (NAD+)
MAGATTTPVRVAAIGGGSFGTCVARIAATAVQANVTTSLGGAAATDSRVLPGAGGAHACGAPWFDPTVRMWVRREALAEEINTQHTNTQYLGASARLPQNISASTNLAEVAAGADVLILGVPHQFLPRLLSELAPIVSPTTQVVSLIKSFDYDPATSDLSSLAERVSSKLGGAQTSVMMGPNIFREMTGDPQVKVEFAEATIGCCPSNVRGFELLPHVFSTPEFSVRVVPDVVGVELCGALKNCITLSCGFLMGFGLGHNAKAAAIRAGHREIVRFGGEFFGVDEAIFSEACGIGDLVLSCTVGRGQMVAAKFVEESSQQRCAYTDTAQEPAVATHVEASCDRWSALEQSLLNGQLLPDWHTIQEVYAFLSKREALDRYRFLATTYRVGFEGASVRELLDAMRHAPPHTGAWQDGAKLRSPMDLA